MNAARLPHYREVGKDGKDRRWKGLYLSVEEAVRIR